MTQRKDEPWWKWIRTLLQITGIGVGSMVAVLTGAVIAAAPAAAEDVPTLGIANPYQYATGFGTVKPASFSFGSMASSTFRQVKWDSWGDASAIGHGVVYDGVDNPDLPVTITAFDLGDCNGQRVYRQVSYKPTVGQTEHPYTQNVCHG